MAGVLQSPWLNRILPHSGNFPERTIRNSVPLKLKPSYAYGNKCSDFSLDQFFSTGVLQNSGVSPEVVQMLRKTVYFNYIVQKCEQGFPRATLMHPWGSAQSKRLRNTVLDVSLIFHQTSFKCFLTAEVGSMRDHLQFLLAPLFLEVILVTKEVSKKIFENFQFWRFAPQKPNFSLVSQKLAV